MDKEKKNTGPFGSPMDAPVRSSDMQELYRRLTPAGQRPNPGSEGLSAALEAAQRLATEMDAEDTANDLAAEPAPVSCSACGHKNRRGNRFCGMCGATVEAGVSTLAPSQPVIPPLSHGPDFSGRASQGGSSETHHYHHHYHHHYFQGSGAEPRAGTDVVREDKFRPNAALRGDMSRAEAAVRRITQEWVLACNTRHLDDLLELYVSDALVFRSNYPPIRGAAAVREFFFGALNAGLGEVEVEPLRVEVVGDFAYEAGRCKALIPSSTGKRREERGKYLWVFARQAGGEWKLAADCWSSDLTLTQLESDIPANTGVKATPPRK